jgi:RNA polymerase sigma factor (sigma-70 family)
MSEDRPDFQTLLKGIRAGSQDAARQMLAIYGKHVLRIIRRRLHKRLRAKFDSGDFAQSVWASFFTAPPSEGHFQRPEDLANFLAAVARNKVVDAVRQRMQGIKYNVTQEKSLEGSAAAEAADLVDGLPSPSQAAMAKENWTKLQAGLGHTGRCILEMRSQGRTHQEIAATLGVSVKTVQRFLRRLDRSTQR